MYFVPFDSRIQKYTLQTEPLGTNERKKKPNHIHYLFGMTTDGVINPFEFKHCVFVNTISRRIKQIASAERLGVVCVIQFRMCIVISLFV